MSNAGDELERLAKNMEDRLNVHAMGGPMADLAVSQAEYRGLIDIIRKAAQVGRDALELGEHVRVLTELIKTRHGFQVARAKAEVNK